MKQYRINITVPVFNRPYLTQRALLQLRKLQTEHKVRINVVDNGSQKELRDLLIQFANDGIIDTLNILQKNMGVSCAVNIGWDCMEADYYIKFDNDIILHDYKFLDKMFEMMSYVKGIAVFGPAITPEMIEESDEIIATPYGKLARCTSNVPGGVLIVPKEVADVLGAFSEDYGLYGADDGDYGLRLNCAGFRQFYYEYERFFTHEGKWDSSEYEGCGLDKHKEHSSLFRSEDGGVGLFPLNGWLYEYCIRSWNVPRRYEICKKNGYFLTVQERHDYTKIRAALDASRKVYEYLFLKKSRRQTLEKRVEKTTQSIAWLKKIWKNCGQECTLENMRQSHHTSFAEGPSLGE